MSKKLIIIIFLLIATSAAAFSFFHLQRKTTRVVQNNKKTAANNSETGVNSPTTTSDNKSFFISGWLPYWEKDGGAQSLSGQLELFSEINPFAFSVAENGALVDKMDINFSPWPALEKAADEQKVAIVPTILWGDAAAMHHVFTDQTMMDSHISAITAMLQKYNFSGVDIDYEGKDIADKDNFSVFIKMLHQKLEPLGKSLNCTVEARTQDAPPAGFTGTRTMSWANDLSVLNETCDSVRVMAYDEVFQVHRANTFEDSSASPSAPNADSRWVEEVVRYALQQIAPEKLILGIPTYGWEFQITKIPSGYRYTRVKSVTYPQALAEAQKAGVIPARTSGGELAFQYETSDGEHLVTFSDAEAVRQKIVLVQQLNLKGISLFKLDGLTDPGLFAMMKKTLAR